MSSGRGGRAEKDRLRSVHKKVGRECGFILKKKESLDGI